MAIAVGAHGAVLRVLLKDLLEIRHIVVNVVFQIEDDTLICVAPVSYTHLDVYKRQDHGIRFNEDERWTCRLQKALGEEYLVTEEGLSGRTTVFVDPLHESCLLYTSRCV